MPTTLPWITNSTENPSPSCSVLVFIGFSYHSLWAALKRKDLSRLSEALNTGASPWLQVCFSQLVLDICFCALLQKTLIQDNRNDDSTVISELSPGCLHAGQFNLLLHWVTGDYFTFKKSEYLFFLIHLFWNGLYSYRVTREHDMLSVWSAALRLDNMSEA